MVKNCLFLLVCLPLCIHAQQKYTLSGTVSEASSNETLIGVSIIVPSAQTGVATNGYGFYSLTLPAGKYDIEVSYLGYQKIQQEVDLSSNTRLNFELIQQSEQLEELVVTDVYDSNIGSELISLNTLSIKTIREIPMVLGEADVVKSLILMPGVTNAGEASSGFNVRGGAVDQNLILLDEATIFNSSHLFGLFSIFNPDAIKDVKLYKGGIPARYGGRVSSVLEIFQKDGNSKDFKMSGGVGAAASRLTAEGPIQPNKSSFLLGGRASYAHLFLPLFDVNNSASFFDLNSKVSFKLNERNSIYLSGYYGKDLFTLNDNYTNIYGNGLANFRWNHLFSDRLFSNLSFIYSNYFSNLDLDFEGLKWDTDISNLNLKYDLKHYVNDKLLINYGMNQMYSTFNPGTVNPIDDQSEIISEQLTKKFAIQSDIYVDAEHEIINKLRLGYGLRFSHFVRLGQDELNIYQNDDPLIFDPFTLVYTGAEPIGERDPGRNGRLARYSNFEPRLSMAYSFGSGNTVKASFTRLAQYLHLISNTSSPTPLDVWAPSGPYIKPLLLNQFAIGYFKQFNDGVYALEIELYKKQIGNRLDYIDGADLIAQNAVEQVIINGEARAQGMEILVQKKTGVFKGWLAYTLSHSEQRTPGRITKTENGRSNRETGINLGKWYNTPYDKTHDLSLHISYDLSKTLTVTGNFAYQTGQPTNFPIGQFQFQGLSAPYFGPRNKERLPDYHRLDLAVMYTPSKSEKRWESQWIFGIYNAYNRLNAASINFRRNQDTNANEVVRTSIFGIVPAITYNFNF